MLTDRPSQVGSDSSSAHKDEEERCGEDELPDWTSIQEDIGYATRPDGGRDLPRLLKYRWQNSSWIFGQ